MIRNINYYDKNIYDYEMDLIHNSSWIFLCLKKQIEKNDDFVTYDVGNIKLVLQNFEGDIKCFENICQHRFNKIQDSYQGNSSFFCKYHSWAYDSKGEALVSDEFKSQLKSEGRTCLKEYEVAICGEFIFVKVNSDSKLKFKEYLGVFFGILEEVSNNFHSLINENYIIIPHKANWKLLVENVLECYHCATVHKETLVPIGIGSKRPENHIFNGSHDMVDYPIRIGKQQKLRSEKLTFLNKKAYLHNSLRHIFIYPNLFITSTDGTLYYVSRLSPRDENNSELLVNFVRPKLDGLSKKEEFIANAFFESSIESASKVIFEDKVILENIQNNLPLVGNISQIFGKEEFRIVGFHENIKNFVKYI